MDHEDPTFFELDCHDFESRSIRIVPQEDESLVASIERWRYAKHETAVLDHVRSSRPTHSVFRCRPSPGDGRVGHNLTHFCQTE